MSSVRSSSQESGRCVGRGPVRPAPRDVVGPPNQGLHRTRGATVALDVATYPLQDGVRAAPVVSLAGQAAHQEELDGAFKTILAGHTSIRLSQPATEPDLASGSRLSEVLARHGALPPSLPGHREASHRAKSPSRPARTSRVHRRAQDLPERRYMRQRAALPSALRDGRRSRLAGSYGRKARGTPRLGCLRQCLRQRRMRSREEVLRAQEATRASPVTHATLTTSPYLPTGLPRELRKSIFAIAAQARAYAAATGHPINPDSTRIAKVEE